VHKPVEKPGKIVDKNIPVGRSGENVIKLLKKYVVSAG
jgi:hypothetical protein